GLLVLIILILIAVSTAQHSTGWFRSEGLSGIFSQNYDGQTHFGALAFLFGTAISSVIAIIISVPVSIAIALLLTEVLPRRWAQPIVSVIAVPAVFPRVVGALWGIRVLGRGLQNDISAPVGSALDATPVLATLFGPPINGASFFTAGMILAVMITPIITSL